jgi:hypothetical protein
MHQLKYIIFIFLFIIICPLAKCQSIELLEDSLTNKTFSSWVQCDSNLSIDGHSDLKYTFYKNDKKGVLTDHARMKKAFRWTVLQAGNGNLVQVKLDGENQTTDFLIQIIKENGRARARLTKSIYNKKQFIRFCRENN